MAKKTYKNSREEEMDTPEYKSWRWGVFSLCEWTCQMAGCGHKGNDLQAHHIVRWADEPKLRYDVTNGICLCETCHHKVTGREDKYEDYFRKIIKQKIKLKKAQENKTQRKQTYQNTKKKREFEEQIKKQQRKRFLRNPRLRF